MNTEDEIWLKKFNTKKSVEKQCSEGIFEEVMNFFEETSQAKQPFAAVDNPPVVSYDEMKASFDEDERITDQHIKFSQAIYEHWKNRRMLQGNQALMPSLKFETNAETDDSDPYVCFRRREIRQTRKTRGRDAQVTEKLKKLRKELEDARQLMHLVKQREILRKEQLHADRRVFEQREELRAMKRKLGVKDVDEDLLINQKVRPVAVSKFSRDTDLAQPAQKKPKVELNNMRPVTGGVPRPMLQPGGRPLESDLPTLDESVARTNHQKARYIAENKQKHKNWNQGFIDDTTKAIDPLRTPGLDPGWAQAAVNFGLPPTPPPSLPDEQSFRAEDADRDSGMVIQDNAVSSYPSPPKEVDGPQMKIPDLAPALEGWVATEGLFSPLDEGPPARCTRQYVRQRRGRGGRLFIDRRPIPSTGDTDMTPEVLIDGSYEKLVYPVDPYGNDTILHRTSQMVSQSRRSMGATPQSQGHNASRPVNSGANG